MSVQLAVKTCISSSRVETVVSGVVLQQAEEYHISVYCIFFSFFFFALQPFSGLEKKQQQKKKTLCESPHFEYECKEPNNQTNNSLQTACFLSPEPMSEQGWFEAETSIGESLFL